jgi:hypothetical protein
LSIRRLSPRCNLPPCRPGFAGCARRSARLGGAAVVAVASITLALVSSRATLAVGAAMLVWAVAAPEPTVGAGRRQALAAVAFAVTCGAAGDAVAGSYADPYTAAADWPRLCGLALVLAIAPVLWALQWRLAAPGRGAAALTAAVARRRRFRARRRAGSPTTCSSKSGSSSATRACCSPSPFWGPRVGQPFARRNRRGGCSGRASARTSSPPLVDWPWHVPASAAIFAFLAGGASACASQRQMHDVQADVASVRQAERLGDGPDDVEAE